MNAVFDLMNHPVSELMSTKILAVIPTDSLEKVKEIFDTHNIHHIPVVRYKDLVGFISKTDFYKALGGAQLDGDNAEEMLKNRKAEDIMVTHIVKLDERDKIGTAAEVFLKNYFHAVPVLNADKELVGIVSTYDIIKFFFHEAYPGEELKKFV